MNKSKILNKQILTGIFIGLVCFGIGFSLNYLLTDMPVPESTVSVDRWKLQSKIANDIGYVRLEFTDLSYHWPNENRSWIFLFPNDISVSYDMDHFNFSNAWIPVDYWVTLLSHPGDDMYVKVELLWYIPAFVVIESIGSINQTIFFDSYYAKELDEAWTFYFWHGDDWATLYNTTNPITGEEESYWVPNCHSFFAWGYYHLIPK